MHVGSFTLAAPVPLSVAAAIGLIAAVTAWVRRPTIPLVSWVLFALGLLALILAAGRPAWLRPSSRTVAVMVDLSASTRGAVYRQPAALRRRIAELLGPTPFEIFFFADKNEAGTPGDSALPDVPSSQTVFAPPPAAAVLLFSDGRFTFPDTGPPVYAVIDPGLDSVNDAAISRMEFRGDQVAMSVRNTGPPRALTLHGVKGPTTAPVDGNVIILRPVDPAVTQITAELSPADAWPENDVMTLRASPQFASQRWWIGAASPAGWRAIAPKDLPGDAVDYLAPAVIVLNNVSAGELSEVAQDRLRQYVRDLGGSLVILGGDHAFAAGGYDGSAIDALSPLASSPPSPTTLWMLLADASGSMASSAGGNAGVTQWDLAAGAMVRLLRYLPPQDPVRVGQFSDTLRWWSDGKSARQTAALSLPPADSTPHGPTNLEPVLEAIARDADTVMPKELLLLTDADVDIKDPAGLGARLKAKKIQLHLLAIGNGSGLGQLQQIIAITGGSTLKQLDPAKWAASIQELLRTALPNRLSRDAVEVNFLGATGAMKASHVAPWNRTWLKSEATPLAQGSAPDGPITLAATWQLGAGKVLAASFASTADQATALAALIAQPPRDPRLMVAWESGPILHVSVDAVDRGAYLNDLQLMLEMRDVESNGPRVQVMKQTGPGRYEASLPAPPRPAIAIVKMDDRVLDRFAVAGRYAPEFGGIGIDHAALKELASQTGGAVITPRQTTPILFDWPSLRTPLTSWLAIAGAALICIGLVSWRRQ